MSGAFDIYHAVLWELFGKPLAVMFGVPALLALAVGLVYLLWRLWK